MLISGVALFYIASCLAQNALGNPYLNFLNQNSGEILGRRNSLRSSVYNPFSQNALSRQQDSGEISGFNFGRTVRSPFSSLRSSWRRQSDSGELRTRRHWRPSYLGNVIRRSNPNNSGERGTSWASLYGSLRRRVNRLDSGERFGINRAYRNFYRRARDNSGERFGVGRFNRVRDNSGERFGVRRFNRVRDNSGERFGVRRFNRVRDNSGERFGVGRFNRVRDNSGERFGVRRIRNFRFGRRWNDSGEQRNRLSSFGARNFRRFRLDSGEKFGGRMLNVRRRFSFRDNSGERTRFGGLRTRRLRRINFRPFTDNSDERRGLVTRNFRSVVRRMRSPFSFQRRRLNNNSGERLSLFNNNWNTLRW
ncbi:uncharacterized protein LOC125662479 [Ostrea edulis]|uniref:uncharacterized protein LOC125662479 n=1 Tax=Ostrea edulis TaxID=37623 RepID=UPI0024AEBC8E|nr:uncharacterized protein LOC125662479 [Ostrea edulis]